MRTYGQRALSFRRDGTGLAVCHGRAVVVRVVPDERWPGMWRVRYPDGRLTDLVNITRAKDAAFSIALRILQGEETPREGAPARFSQPEAPEAA